MLFFITIIYLFIYFRITIKNYENFLSEKNIILSNSNVVLSIFYLIMKFSILINGVSFLILNFGLVYYMIFHFIFFDFFILSIRFEFLRLRYFINFDIFSYKVFFSERFGVDFFVFFLVIERKIRKFFLLSVPFLFYFFDSKILYVPIVLILLDLKYFDFDKVFDEAFFFFT